MLNKKPSLISKTLPYKLKTLGLGALFAAGIFSSCSKDNNEPEVVEAKPKTYQFDASAQPSFTKLNATETGFEYPLVEKDAKDPAVSKIIFEVVKAKTGDDYWGTTMDRVKKNLLEGAFKAANGKGVGKGDFIGTWVGRDEYLTKEDSLWFISKGFGFKQGGIPLPVRTK